jgi:hypothetical protein
LRTEPADIGHPNDLRYGVTSLVVGRRKYGESLSLPLQEIKSKYKWIGVG